MSLRLRHPVYFLVAFVAACLSWYAATGQRRATISVRNTRASLTLVNLPGDLVLTSGVPDTISLQLRGPLSLIAKKNDTMEVYLDLSEAHPGKKFYAIDLAAIPAPQEIEILSAEPAEIEIELERLVVRSLPVQPMLEGIPAPGFVVGAVRAQPEQARVQGPERRLAQLEVLETAPISVEGATATLDLNVDLQIDDPFIRVLNSLALKVRIEILPQGDPAPRVVVGMP